MRFPYLASALFVTRMVAVEQANVVAVDEAWRLYIDPALVDTWDVAQLGSVVVHHVGHLLRDHAARARTLGLGRKQAERWVLAADAEINDDLDGAGLEFPIELVTPQSLGFEPHRFAEEYFHAVTARQAQARVEAAPKKAGAATTKCDCGSGCDGLPRNWEQPGGLSDSQRVLLRCQVASDILRCCRGLLPGTVPVGLQRWAEGTLGARVDWRRVLAAEIRRALALVSGMVDYSYRRPSRRAATVEDVILPGFVRPAPEVAVVIDTSGSMNEELLGRALAEVEGLLRVAGDGRGRLRVIPCDTAAHGVQRVSAARQIELLGGGGTNMGEGIAAAIALRPRPNLVVVLTDGFTPWPAEPPPGVKVVVGLLCEGHVAPPMWARVVRIEPT
jgi:predicted metal-dependent peptidase